MIPRSGECNLSLKTKAAIGEVVKKPWLLLGIMWSGEWCARNERRALPAMANSTV